MKFYSCLSEILVASILLPDSARSDTEPCQDVTLGDCVMRPGTIVETNSHEPSLCQALCGLIDDCTFWRHDGTTCYYLHTNYHFDCDTIGGSIDSDIDGCLSVDYSTCEAILEDSCVYQGRQVEFE